MTEPNPCAMVFSDGVFYDPQDRLFKMWYMAGYVAGTAYATSKDGIHWTKPELDVVPGTNLVQKGWRDSSTVWLDLDAGNPQSRFKMAYFTGGRLVLQTSPDGIHWSEPVHSGPTGDRTTFFYNPFRQKWIYGIRAGASGFGRIRQYWEAADFLRRGPVEVRRAGPVGRRRQRRPAAGRSEDADAAVQPRLRGLREPAAGPVHHLARPAVGPGQAERGLRGLQPRRLPLASPRSAGVHPGFGKARRLELGQRPVGRRRLPGRGRPAVLLRQRPERDPRLDDRRASARPRWPRFAATDSHRSMRPTRQAP